MTLTKTVAVVWDVTPCGLFGSTDVAQKSANFFFSVQESVLKVQAAGSSEKLVNSYQITWCHTEEHRPPIARIMIIPSCRPCKLIMTLHYFP